MVYRRRSTDVAVGGTWKRRYRAGFWVIERIGSLELGVEIKGVGREPTVGFQFTPTQIVVTEAIQREKLGQCEDVNGERPQSIAYLCANT